MKILVPVKRVIDPYSKIHVNSNGTGIDTQQVKMTMNPFDEIALEEAIRWQEAKIASEIVVLSIGLPAVQETLRAALALGADSAIHIVTENILEPLAIAKCLATIVKQHQFAVVIMGKQAIDDDCNQTGQMLAALLDWPQATFASKITFSNDKKNIIVSREIDTGLETLAIRLPAVITTDLRLNEPRYASLPNIMQAKRKLITTVALTDLKVDSAARLKRLAITPPPARKAGKLVNDVTQLLHYLRDVEKII